MVSVTIFDLYNKSNFFSSLMYTFPQNVIPYGNYIRFFYTENVEFLTNWSSKNPEYSLLCTDFKYTGLMVHAKTNQLLLQHKGKIQKYIINKIITGQNRLQVWLQTFRVWPIQTAKFVTSTNCLALSVSFRKKGESFWLYLNHIWIGNLNMVLQDCHPDFI
jgi:hypothetical protein